LRQQHIAAGFRDGGRGALQRAAPATITFVPSRKAEPEGKPVSDCAPPPRALGPSIVV
jgi:hypothetical protein